MFDRFAARRWMGGCAPFVVVGALVLSTASCEPDPCHDVDFLFVVDDSPSMGDNTANIVAAAPALAQTIRDAVGPGVEPHVGVVTGDAYKYNSEACRKAGALVTHRAGDAPNGGVCGPFMSERAFVGPEDDVAAGLACLLDTGAGGAVDEDLAGAALAAVGPALNADGACNEDFVRPGSLLVVTFVTDEDLGVPPQAPPPAPAAPATVRPRIDVAFILDTTGSMGAEIDIVKAHLMAISRRLGNGEPRPDIRYAVVAYRDRGDLYVTKTLPFERDLVVVDGFLRGLTADGGGDEPEDVAAALRAAAELSWEPGDNVDRVAFLVGDAPPHRYPGEPDWRSGLSALANKGVRINALGARNLTAEARTVFAEIGTTTKGFADSLTYRMAKAPDGTPQKAALLQDMKVWLVDAALPPREWKRGARALAADGLATLYAGPSPNPGAFTENNLDGTVATELVDSAARRGTRFDPPTAAVPPEQATQWAAQLVQQSGHPPERVVVVGISRQDLGKCSVNDDGQDAVALAALGAQFATHGSGDLCNPQWSTAVAEALKPIADQCADRSDICANAGPSTKDWLLSTLLMLVAAVGMVVVGQMTLTRILARRGFRQGPAGPASVGLGLLTGGVVAWIVAVARQCGWVSAPGWMGIAVSLLGLVILGAALATGRRR